MSKIIYVSGPSGMAKTKVKEKLDELAGPLGIQFERVIVATSRDMRQGESQGNPWYFKSTSDIEAEMLRRLVARRAANLDNMPIEKLRKRAQNAVQEYAVRRQYDRVIVNHQGEESPQWGVAAEFPTAEAASVLQQFLRVMAFEQWSVRPWSWREGWAAEKAAGSQSRI